MCKNQRSGGGDDSMGGRNFGSPILFTVCRKNAAPAGWRQDHPAQSLADSLLVEGAIGG
jgi:hypothetical protein